MSDVRTIANPADPALARGARSLNLSYLGDWRDGVVVAQAFNWTGQVLAAPRGQLAKALRRKEASYSGVYLLIGEADGQAAVYIGEGDHISDRLKAHDADQDWWSAAVLITAGENRLDKAHVRYLEARLIDRASRLGRARLVNRNRPSAEGLGEGDRADMEAFLADLFFVLAGLHIEAFTPAQRAAPKPRSRTADVSEGETATANAADRIARVEAQVAELRRMAEAGMTLIHRLTSDAPRPAPDRPRLDPAEAFARLSRGVHLTFVYENRLEDEIAAMRAGDFAPYAPAPREGASARRESGREAAPEEVREAADEEAQDSERPERLREAERHEAFSRLPFEAAAAVIREALGLCEDGGLWPAAPVPAPRAEPRPSEPSSDRSPSASFPSRGPSQARR